MSKRFKAAVLLAVAVLPAPAVAGQDSARGRQVFQQYCAACHSVEPGRMGMGPNLAGVVGRAAAAARFIYSPAMKNSRVVWTDPRLDAFLKAPAAVVRGNRMAFPGLPAPQDRADVIAFLKGRP